MTMSINKTDKAERSDAQLKRRPARRRKKVCVFCTDENAVIDYSVS